MLGLFTVLTDRSELPKLLEVRKNNIYMNRFLDKDSPSPEGTTQDLNKFFCLKEQAPAEGVAQLVECHLAFSRPWTGSPAPHKLDVV